MLMRNLIAIMVMGVVIVVGCNKQEDTASKVDESIATPLVKKEMPRPAMQKPAIVLTPMDSQDDIKYATFFPVSDRVVGWIKTSPVAGGDASKLGEYAPERANVLAAYGIESIAVAGYQRAYEGKIESVQAMLIKAKSKKDAYGLLSVSCPGQDILKPGEVWRTDGGEQMMVKGDYFMLFSGVSNGDAEHLKAGVEMLMAKTAFEMSDRAEIPMIVQVFQVEDLPAETTLFVHELQGLEGPAGKEILDVIGQQELDRLNKILGLGKDVDLGIAIYKSDDWLGPNIIWLARYSTPEKAQGAYYRYRKVAKAAKESDKLMYNSFFKAPRGRFFLGTWTVESESLSHLTQKIEKYLP
jgi:hypothetical protein